MKADGYQRPLVTIGMPLYNEERHLSVALDSLIAQDYENIEIVISDNASTDSTPVICADYAARDARIRYHRNEENLGGVENFNRVFDLARGDFFMWAAGHDIRHPSQISRCLEVLLEDPSIVLCYSQVFWVNEEGERLEKVHEYLDTRSLDERLLRLNVVLWGIRGGFPIYGVFRTEALRKTSVYTHVVAPDQALLIELATVGKFAYIAEPPFHLRQAEDYGNWEVYVTKHFKQGLTGRDARKLYWRMVRELSVRVASHIRTPPGKALGVMCVTVCMLVKFRWMLTLLRSLKMNAAADARVEAKPGSGNCIASESQTQMAERKPIHVLLVSNTSRGLFVGGADRDWVNLLNALGPDHLRVTWVGISGSEELRKYVDERVLVRTIDIPHPCFYGLVPDNAYKEKSKWLWTKTITASSLILGRQFLELRHALRFDPVDLVISNTAVVLLGAVFARLTGRPHIWNVKEYLDPQVAACRRFARIITRFSSAVVVPSKVIGEAFESRVHVLPDGGDIENIKSSIRSSREQVLRSLDLPTNLLMVAQAGAISQRKGQYLTAEAFVRLAQSGGPPAFSLIFFGGGDSQELERLNLILSQAPEEWRTVVRFSTFVQDDLSPLAAADIVVHPSMFNDAFPNAVREAMILGKPVIASALGGIPDMIIDGVNGVLIRPGDAEVLATALERLVRLPDQRRELGAAAEVFAGKNFDIHVRKLAFLDLINQVFHEGVVSPQVAQVSSQA